MLADLTIHEAMPGHFLQLMHNNKFPSKVRAVFSSGPVRRGLGGLHRVADGPRTASAARRCGCSGRRWCFASSVNAVLDHGIHAGDDG